MGAMESLWETSPLMISGLTLTGKVTAGTGTLPTKSGCTWSERRWKHMEFMFMMENAMDTLTTPGIKTESPFKNTVLEKSMVTLSISGEDMTAFPLGKMDTVSKCAVK